MGLFYGLKKEKLTKEQCDNLLIKPDKEYLKSLIQDVNKKFEQFKYRDIDENDCDIFYIPTKKLSYIGLQSGLSEEARLKKNNLQKVTKIRSNCKNYIRLIEKDNQIIKIESIKKGTIDSTYLSYYDKGYRYLFPYTKTGYRYPTYISVTYFENDQVSEEYLVQKDQIVYSRYSKCDESKVDYYYINYVPNGKYPVIEEKIGYYLLDSLEYVEKEYYVWIQDRQP
ncbi:hypothetical protein [Candidatus Stoquefichus sp. SB1]|uniref:hypothetical protein n=1 Tax=Candidatus Stoquefichus sp. SB1 TaxID=1658109 RepID=UPI00067F0A50|nr:hypothetical protein [Candidatus Stoquefichus sp. SB1]